MTVLDLDQPATLADAGQRLAREFPRVPLRVIAAVLTAYDRISGSVPDATRAARARIRDACAT